MPAPEPTPGRRSIAVIGLGKIGLPLAAQFALKGHAVIGCDINPEVVATISAGRSHVRGEAMLDDRVAETVADGRLHAATDTVTAVSRSNVVVSSSRSTSMRTAMSTSAVSTRHSRRWGRG